MTREDWVRLGKHVPWGGLAAALYWFVSPVFGIVALGAEFIYEGFQDWRKGDNSFKDCLGITWGWLIGGIIIGVFQIIG